MFFTSRDYELRSTVSKLLFTGFLPDGSALSSFRVVSATRKAGGVARLSGLQAKPATRQSVAPCEAPAAAPRLTYSLLWQAAAPLPRDATAGGSGAAKVLPAASHEWLLDSRKQRCAMALL